jgi:phage terminase large subunit-like protein
VTSPIEICPGNALAHLAPDFIASLSEVERAVLPYMYDLWLRPEQRVPRHAWRSFGFICGRGYGKSLAVAVEINRRIKAGETTSLALMAPNEKRVEEVQIKFLIDTSPPWFKAERFNGSIVWPNGVTAEVFTPEAPGRSRSGNFQVSWLCELVDWQATTRREAFDNITTATRVRRNGIEPQYFWDTTARGRNDVIQYQIGECAADPARHILRRGSTFDNPLLSRNYIESVCRGYSGRQFREEILGEVFTGSAGALWEQTTLELHRRPEAPARPDLTIIAIDPAITVSASADETGIIVAARGRDGHTYILADLSGRLTPDQWGTLVVKQCLTRAAAGVVFENNRGGLLVQHVLKVAADTAGVQLREAPKDKPFPRHTPGVIYFRSVTARDSKGVRAAGPAAETDAGRVHLVGHFAELEAELTTFEPGVNGQLSPNRYDAAVYAVLECAELTLESKLQPAAAMSAAVDMAKKFQEMQRGRSRGIGL